MTEPTHIPEALYSCAMRWCAEDRSYPADGLHWYSEPSAWLCCNCADQEWERGITLADHLARKQPAADLAGYPVDVVEGMAQFAADQRPPDPEAAAILEECQSELMGEPVRSGECSTPDHCPEAAAGHKHSWHYATGETVDVVGSIPRDAYRRAMDDVHARGITDDPYGIKDVDPVAVALREAILAKDVPEWAVWVTWDLSGIWAWEHEMHEGSGGRDSAIWVSRTSGRYKCLRGTALPFDIDWRTTKRRVADVWKGGE